MVETDVQSKSNVDEAMRTVDRLIIEAKEIKKMQMRLGVDLIFSFSKTLHELKTMHSDKLVKT